MKQTATSSLFPWLAAGFLAACVVLLPDLAVAAEPMTEAAAPTYEVQVLKDLVYRDLHPGESASEGKHKLDLYLPRGRADFPVLFFVHGGAWRHGDKGFLGFYNALGRFWARQGIGTVVTNYRLSPAVQHPGHISDVVRAFAWTVKNIAQHGGRPDQVFLCGHSAGGHLVSLLATDESYLQGVGLTRQSIRGVIPISGVYDVRPGDFRLFASVFGTDAEVRRKASPICCVGEKSPPFLILYADRDFPTCDLVSERFCRALCDARCPAKTLEVKESNHVTILLRTCTAGDPVVRAIQDFIATHMGRTAS